jgi:hypothetical protein
MSNLFWNPCRGVERTEGLREVKGDSIHWVVRVEGKCVSGLELDGSFVIVQTVGWAKTDPIHWMVITMRDFTHCHLR